MPLPSDVLEGAKLKVRWADEKIEDFSRVKWGFFNSQPYVKFRELDTQASEYVIKAKLGKPLPIDLLRLTIECIQHLASALDHVLYALAFRNGATPALLEQIGFPWAKSSAHLDERLKHPAIQAIGPQAIAIIRGAQPYPGGNERLWVIGRLNNIDKHRHMLPVAVGHAGYGIGFVQIGEVKPGQRVDIGRAQPDESLETGIEIIRYTVGLDPEPDPHIDIMPRVLFGNVLAEVDGKDITDVLLYGVAAVTRLLEAVEANCP